MNGTKRSQAKKNGLWKKHFRVLMIGSTALFPISKMEESEEVMMRILLTHQVRKAVVVYGISIASQPRDLAGFCLHTGELIYCFKASSCLP